jgi:hypothetical protein
MSDFSDSSDDCEDEIAVADVDLDDEGSWGGGGGSDCNSRFIWEDIDNYHAQRKIFSGHSGHGNSAANCRDIVSVFL